mmetsp:Transcript_45469/g.103551  ORF Transcript_45469/g.103551 Transcript_45469/m.103551 type:complete len:81 (-) Transcript_45469:100-342(-)
MFEILATGILASAMGPGGTFGYAKLDIAGKPSCVQIGTHGSLTRAELQEIATGGPKAWTPGACPVRFGKLDFGVHILSQE